MTTYTVTEPVQELATLHLQNQAPPAPETAALERLVEIFEQYEKTWTDSRSVFIREWIADIIEINENNDPAFTASFRAAPRAHLDTLINNVFMDQFLPQLQMRSPVLVQEQGWVCERLFFNAYVPKEGEPRFTTIPHEFIKAMFRWVQDATTKLSTEIALRGDVPEPDEDLLRSSPLGRMTLTAYPAIIRGTLFNAKLTEQAAEARAATAALERLRVDIQTETLQQIEEAEARAAVRREQLTTRIANMERDHAEALAELNRRVDEQRIRITDNDIEIDNMRTRASQAELEIARLKRTIQLQAQQIQNLGKKKKKKFLGLF